MFLLPDEVRLLRHIEGKVIAVFTNHSFEEVMFPRLMRTDEWEGVVQSLGHISHELHSEVIQVSPLGGHAHTLCHWQCEPYYKALQHGRENIPNRVYDRSGWSYRNEETESYLRPREFLRTEAVWRDQADRVGSVLSSLLISLAGVLECEGLSVRQVRRGTEIRDSNQRDVIDLVCVTNSGCDVEVVGGHLHGATFVKRFWPEAPEGIETACLGVSLTRITRLLMMKNDSVFQPEDMG